LPAKGEVVNRNWTVTLSSVRNNNIGATSKTFYIEGPYITIEEKFGPRITVTSPKAGDVWTLGSTQTIRWTYKGDPPGPDVKLFPEAMVLITGKFPICLMGIITPLR
jgi:hypothetical protein